MSITEQATTSVREVDFYVFDETTDDAYGELVEAAEQLERLVEVVDRLDIGCLLVQALDLLAYAMISISDAADIVELAANRNKIPS